MTTRRLLLALTFLIPAPITARAADLTRLDRSIAKEPAYRTKSPVYCLLAFGPEAKTHIWLILDGDTLYVDRNGNGDLTEDGERVQASDATARPGRLASKVYTFDAGEVVEAGGKQKHTNLRVQYFVVEPGAAERRPADELKKAKDERTKALLDAYPGHAFIRVDVRLADRVDQCAAPLAADSLRKAPIVHLNGPLTFGLNPGAGDPPPLLADQYGELSVAAAIGTPGVGYNTFALLCFDDIPKDVHPVAEIEFPAKDPGGRPVRTTLELTNRCCRNLFYQPVKVPDGVGPGKAKVIISVTGLKKIEVAPARCEAAVPRKEGQPKP